MTSNDYPNYIAESVYEFVKSSVRKRLSGNINNNKLRIVLMTGILEIFKGYQPKENGTAYVNGPYPESSNTTHPLEEFFASPKISKSIRTQPLFRARVYSTLTRNKWVRKKSVNELQLDMFLDEYTATDYRVDWFICNICDIEYGTVADNESIMPEGEIDPDIESMLNRAGWFWQGPALTSMYKSPNSNERDHRESVQRVQYRKKAATGKPDEKIKRKAKRKIKSSNLLLP